MHPCAPFPCTHVESYRPACVLLQGMQSSMIYGLMEGQHLAMPAAPLPYPKNAVAPGKVTGAG